MSEIISVTKPQPQRPPRNRRNNIVQTTPVGTAIVEEIITRKQSPSSSVAVALPRANRRRQAATYVNDYMSQGPQYAQNEAALRQKNADLRAQISEKNRQLKASASVVKAVQGFKKNAAVSKAAGGSGMEDFVAPEPSMNTTAVVMNQSGASPYLRSLLVPEDGPVSIPDSVMRLHHVRTETVTYNIPMARLYAGLDAPDITTPVSGLLILYPNHPTSLIGYNYILEIQGDDAGNYTPTQILTTAQDLSESYDYGRRTSQLLNIQSSTLPSGMYAINGTFNAVRVDGTVSEMNLQPANLYNSILADTTSSFDKAGAVSVGNGIAVLSIPDSFVLPYTRLSDQSPTAVTTGFISTNVIRDNGSDLDYVYRIINQAPIVAAALANVVILSFSSNLDSTSGFDFSATLNFPTGLGASVTATAQFALNFFDPFGNIVYTTFVAATAISNASSLSFQAFQTWDGVKPPDNDTFAIGPIAGFSCVVTLQTVTGTPTITNGSYVADLKFTAPNAKSPGVNMPIVYVAYQSVAYGSVLTVGGISNFELIPNPELRKNLNLSYGQYNSGEMGYVETIIANREKFDIRSVWDAVEYGRMKDTFRQLADCSQHQNLSRAFGWGDLLRGIRKALPVAANIVKGVFPQATGAIDLAQGLMSKSASGRAIGSVYARASTSVRTRAVSYAGVVPRPSARERFINPRNLKARTAVVPHWMNVVATRAGRSMTGIRAVAFPTITTNENDQETGEMLYAVFRGDFSRLLSESALEHCRSADGKMVYGLARTGGVLFPTGADCTILPIDPEHYAAGRVTILKEAPQVEGHSCDGALWLLANGDFDGMYPAPITGEIRFKDGKVQLESNPLVNSKRAFLNHFGIPLISNDPDADYRVSDLALVRKPPIVSPVTRTPVKKANARLLRSLTRAYAADVSYAKSLASVSLVSDGYDSQPDDCDSDFEFDFCANTFLTLHKDLENDFYESSPSPVDLNSVTIDSDVDGLFQRFNIFHENFALDLDKFIASLKSKSHKKSLPLSKAILIINAFSRFTKQFDTFAERFNNSAVSLQNFVDEVLDTVAID